MKAAIAYVRVSTKHQNDSGFGMEAQLAQIRAFAKLSGIRIKKIYREPASAMGDESFNNRPKLKAALLNSHDKRWPIVVAGFDRLSRETKILDKLSDLIGQGKLNIISASVGLQGDYLAIQSQVARAQFEGEEIGKRTKQGLKEARARGIKFGNPNLAEAQRQGAAANKIAAQIRIGEFENEIAKARGLGARTVADITIALNKSGFQTTRGGLWTAPNVQRLCRTLKKKCSGKSVLKNSSNIPVLALLPAGLVDEEGFLTRDAEKRMRVAMKRRGWKIGKTAQLAEEMGYKRLDPSIGMILSGQVKLKPEKLKRFEYWLKLNEK